MNISTINYNNNPISFSALKLNSQISNNRFKNIAQIIENKTKKGIDDSIRLSENKSHNVTLFTTNNIQVVIPNIEFQKYLNVYSDKVVADTVIELYKDMTKANKRFESSLKQVKKQYNKTQDFGVYSDYNSCIDMFKKTRYIDSEFMQKSKSKLLQSKIEKIIFLKEDVITSILSVANQIVK